MKYALIVNGDTEARHLQNVERSLAVLDSQGYETFVASPSRPEQKTDHYVRGTKQDVQTLVESLKSKITDQDELVIYTTGHGGQVEGEGTLCLEEGCDHSSVTELLDKIRYGKRTVIMDQCFSGNWNKIFLNDPKTLFVSSGSKNEEVCCQEFSPQFWSDKASDTNGDGVISWQERYAYAVADRALSSVPQFVASEGYTEEGQPSFPAKVSEIQDRAELETTLKKLKPGQYAVIAFSASWCGLCQVYKPLFDKMAEENKGQYLFLRTENEALASDYGANGFPTVMAISGEGAQLKIQNRNDLFGELTQFAMPEGERVLHRIANAEKIEDPLQPFGRIVALSNIASQLVKANRKDLAIPLFKKVISEAERMATPYYRAIAFICIASALVKAGWKDQAISCFQKTTTEAEKIENPSYRATVFGYMVTALFEAELKEQVIPFFKNLIIATGKMENLADRECVFNSMALPLYIEAFSNICSVLTKTDIKDQVIPLFQKLITVAEKIGNPFYRAKAFIDIASNLAQAKLGDQAISTFQKAIDATETMEAPYDRIRFFGYITDALIKAGFIDQAVSAFQKWFNTVEKIERPDNRIWAFRSISGAMAQASLHNVPVIPLFKNLIAVAKTTKESSDRANILGYITIDLARAGLKNKIHG